jgi:hypothetical protein
MHKIYSQYKNTELFNTIYNKELLNSFFYKRPIMHFILSEKRN